MVRFLLLISSAHNFTAVLELGDIKKVTIQRGDLRRGSEPLMDSNAFYVRIIEIMEILDLFHKLISYIFSILRWKVHISPCFD